MTRRTDIVTVAIAAVLALMVVSIPAGSAPEQRPGLLLEYRFDGSLADSSGNGHDGRASGNIAFAQGREGQCLKLSGDGGYVDSGTNLPMLKDTFTVECWVNPGEKQRPYADIIGNHADHGQPNGFVLQQDGERPNEYYFSYGTGTGYMYSKTIRLTPNKWQHVAIVKTSTRLRFYIDGVLVDSRASSAAMALSTTPVMIGVGIRPEAGRYFNGLISEVRIWDRAQSFRSTLPPAQQLEQFARTGQVEATPSARWGVFRPGMTKDIVFHIDPDVVPESVQTISLALSCADDAGRAIPFPRQATLTRANCFHQRVPVPDLRGHYQVTWKSSVIVAGRALNLSEGNVAFAVLSDAEPEIVSRSAADAAGTSGCGSVMPLDGQWLLATDPRNEGQDGRWFAAARPEAKPTKVPWIIQDAFPGYHGLAWYWREFTAPRSAPPGGRYLLRFWAVDYRADVWLNGKPVGGHEGGETPFVLDATGAIKPGARNVVAVRVLNPTHTAIDGIVLNQTPHRDKFIPFFAGGTYNFGGITGAVELMTAPAVRVEDLAAFPDPATGRIRVRANVRNAAGRAAGVRLEFAVGPAMSGETADVASAGRSLPVGDTAIEAGLQVRHPHLWELNDPYLYRVTLRVVEDGAGTPAVVDERTVRCGFRDFRFAQGYFRLNGRRIFVRSAHTVNTMPVGIQIPPDPDFLRRDMLNLKAMGFNMVRFIWGGASREQLDLCDELGLMAYEESYASWPMDDSPKMGERFDRSVCDLIRRDRNHPSVVIWGLLNETGDSPAFQHATHMLPVIRLVDDSRMIFLNSSRCDGCADIGSLCNPGSGSWENVVGDIHVYPRVPHTADTIQSLREMGTSPTFLSEYGIGSGNDLWRIARHFEQIGKADAEDAQYYRSGLDRFLADYEHWRMADAFGRPADFFTASLRKMAGQRALGFNAIRANPNLVAHSMTCVADEVSCGEGLWTTFREPKPGAYDALNDCWAPLRLCLFAEPQSIYRGQKVKIEAVLANEDALQPGDYPLRLEILGPDNREVFGKTVTVSVAAHKIGAEPPYASRVFTAEVPVDGPSGVYRFVAGFERGAAATGGEMNLRVTDPAEMPTVSGEVTLWGEDAQLAGWLAAHGIRTRPFAPEQPAQGEVILVSRTPAGGAEAFAQLRERIVGGATAVFLCPEVFAKGDDPVGWLPLANRGTLKGIVGWLYLKDEWAKRHPIFEGLQAGGLMDYEVYREIIPDLVFSGQDPPDEAVAGANKVSQDYDSGLMVSVYKLGTGRMVLNTLRIRENLGTQPVAERLLRNMLRFAGGGKKD